MQNSYYDKITHALEHGELPDLLIGKGSYFIMARGEGPLMHSYDMMLDFLAGYAGSHPKAALKRRVTEAVRQGLDSDNPGYLLDFSWLLADARWRREQRLEPMVDDLDALAARAAQRMEARRDEVVAVLRYSMNDIIANAVFNSALKSLTTRTERIR